MAGEGLCGTAGRGPHRPSRGGNTGEPGCAAGTAGCRQGGETAGLVWLGMARSRSARLPEGSDAPGGGRGHRRLFPGGTAAV